MFVAPFWLPQRCQGRLGINYLSMKKRSQSSLTRTRVWREKERREKGVTTSARVSQQKLYWSSFHQSLQRSRRRVKEFAFGTQQQKDRTNEFPFSGAAYLMPSGIKPVVVVTMMHWRANEF